MNDVEARIVEVGRFVRWGQQVSVDMARKMLRIIPEAQREELVEIPNADVPSDEALDIRCSWY